MKKSILTIVAALFVSFGFTGCTPQILEGISPENGKQYNGLINRKVETSADLRIFTMEESNPKAKFDQLVKAAAKDYQKRGVEYFTVSGFIVADNQFVNGGINNQITNIKDSMDYCFPNAFGLEKKCKALEAEKIVMFFKAEQKDYFRPQWSVKEVLSHVIKDDKELILKEVSDTKDIYKVK